jgi:hypothetical protein
MEQAFLWFDYFLSRLKTVYVLDSPTSTTKFRLHQLLRVQKNAGIVPAFLDISSNLAA